MQTPSRCTEQSSPITPKVQITVYDVLGRRVATLANDSMAAGTYRMTLKAGELPAGVYVIRARVESPSEGAKMFTRKVTLVK